MTTHDGHTDANLDRARSGGGEDARWGQDAENPAILPGDWVLAPVLETIAAECGMIIAGIVDEESGPCPACGIHTYGGDVCNRCEDIALAQSNRGPVVVAELSGAFSPREI